MNLTPDSFYPGSRIDAGNFVARALQYLKDGAGVLDIGAESSRPGSDPVSAEDEWNRLHGPLISLKDHLGPERFKQVVSIDTYKGETAQKALEMGVGIINDISGGADEELLKAVAGYEAQLVLMHSKGSPKTMQDNPQYEDVVEEVLGFLNERSEKALSAGVKKENIIWDYGIGFGKTLEHNLALLNAGERFRANGFRLLAGVSRKSFIGKLLAIDDVERRKDPTMIIHTYLALRGVDILRVHDVAETAMIRKIVMAIE